MKVIVTTRDTSDGKGNPIIFDDAEISFDRGILTIDDFDKKNYVSLNSNYWNSVTYGGRQ